MIEPLFEIKDRSKAKNSHHCQQVQQGYDNLLREYLGTSYGYYTDIFIKKIVQESQKSDPELLKYNLRRAIREVVRKYLLNDLEVIFLAYFAKTNLWNLDHPVIQKHLDSVNPENIIEVDGRELSLFLNLVAYFVKSYVGNKQQFEIIKEYLNVKVPEFAQIFDQWLAKSKRQQFMISPRQLNDIYRQHSKNVQNRSYRKDYNEMADRILQLSTTYAIMPCKTVSPKKGNQPKKKENIRSIESSFIEVSQKSSTDKPVEFKPARRENTFIPSLKRQAPVENTTSEPKAKKVLLTKKRKLDNGAVNAVVTRYFQENHNSGLIDETIRNNSTLARDINPVSFLDLNGRSSQIENIPFNVKQNSGLFNSHFFS